MPMCVCSRTSANINSSSLFFEGFPHLLCVRSDEDAWVAQRKPIRWAEAFSFLDANCPSGTLTLVAPFRSRQPEESAHCCVIFVLLFSPLRRTYMYLGAQHLPCVFCGTAIPCWVTKITAASRPQESPMKGP